MKNTVKVIASIFVAAVVFAGCTKTQNSSATSAFGKSKKNDYLTVVSKKSPMKTGADSNLDLVTADTIYKNEKTKVERKTYEAFLELQASLKSKGIEIGIDSAYRSFAEQEQVMQDFIKKYGEEYARKTVAAPGTSEHHTGLAIDIVPKVNGEWVSENADMLELPELFGVIHMELPRFGFILRYPYGKEAITGCSYEPWHIRYIGNKKIAQTLLDEDLALEEYLSSK